MGFFYLQLLVLGLCSSYAESRHFFRYCFESLNNHKCCHFSQKSCKQYHKHCVTVTRTDFLLLSSLLARVMHIFLPIDTLLFFIFEGKKNNTKFTMLKSLYFKDHLRAVKPVPLYHPHWEKQLMLKR